MKFTENDLFLYICGDLPDDKAAEVEIALSNNNELMSLKEKLQKMNQNARDFGKAEFQKQKDELGITDAEIDQKFSDFKQQIERETYHRITYRRVWAFTGIATLILLLVSLIVIQPFGQKNTLIARHPTEEPPETPTDTEPLTVMPGAPAPLIIPPEILKKYHAIPEEQLRGLVLLDSGIDPEILSYHVPGDVIVLVDDQPVGTFAELREILKGRADTEKVMIRIQQQDSEILIGTPVLVGWLRSLEPGIHAEEYQAYKGK